MQHCKDHIRAWICFSMGSEAMLPVVLNLRRLTPTASESVDMLLSTKGPHTNRHASMQNQSWCTAREDKRNGCKKKCVNPWVKWYTFFFAPVSRVFAPVSRNFAPVSRNTLGPQNGKIKASLQAQARFSTERTVTRFLWTHGQISPWSHAMNLAL